MVKQIVRDVFVSMSPFSVISARISVPVLKIPDIFSPFCPLGMLLYPKDSYGI